MGSPLSPFLAEFVLQHIESTVFTKANFLPFYYRRYVDDAFVIWTHNHLDFLNLVNDLNSVHPSIQFTYEIEKNKSLNFLDVKISRPYMNYCYFDVYKKNPNSTSIIPFDSFQPFNHKLNSICSHVRRAYTHTTFLFQLNRELKFIKNLSLDNGYPEHIFNHINYKLHKCFNSQFFSIKLNSASSSKSSPIKYTSPIPYHPNLINIVKHIKKNYNIIIPFSKGRSFANILVQDRDNKIPSGGVYKIPIVINSTVKYYIGQTKRLLCARIKDHQESIKKELRNTTLACFIYDSNNAIPKWNDTVILASPPDELSLKMRETIEIFLNSDHCINANGSVNLDEIWYSLLKDIFHL